MYTIPLNHSNLKVKRFCYFLSENYNDKHILKCIVFVFPLDLQEDFYLQPVLKIHSGSYDYFTYVNKFVNNELECGGMTGPIPTSPFNKIMISPIMTFPKKLDLKLQYFDEKFFLIVGTSFDAILKRMRAFSRLRFDR